MPRELREVRGRAGVGAGVVFSPTESHRLGGVLLASPSMVHENAFVEVFP